MVQTVEKDEQEKNLLWMFSLSIIIGIFSGIFAWLFRLLIGVIHNFAFYGDFSLFYEANKHSPASSWGWLVIFVPVIGGIIVVWLVKTFAPQAKGHGVPEVIDAIHYNKGIIPGKVSLVKAIASSLTIGTGGSLGREGPIVQIGAAFSSAIGQWLKLPARQRIVLIACGSSGGIAATFNAPLAGLLFSIELLLVSINSQTILPVALSTAIAAYVGRLLIGIDPAFDIPTLQDPQSNLTSIYEFMLMVPFGALIGLLSVVFVKGIYWAEDKFDAIPVNDYVRHIIGTLSLGILFYLMLKFTGHYYVQGVGYSVISDILSGVLNQPLFLLLLLGLKLLSTCLTIGSGGSGGVFSPSLFLGAAMGGLVGHFLHNAFPALGVEPVTFALVGMAALVAAATSAPLTAAVITYEMTLDYSIILPLMIAIGVAYAVRRMIMESDIYTLKLLRRGHIVPEGLASDYVGNLKVDSIMNRHFRLMDFKKTFSSFDGITIVTNDGAISGVIQPFDRPVEYDVSVEDLMHTGFVVLNSNLSLTGALRYLGSSHARFAIISKNARPNAEDIVGVLSESEIHQILSKTAELHQGYG